MATSIETLVAFAVAGLAAGVFIDVAVDRLGEGPVRTRAGLRHALSGAFLALAAASVTSSYGLSRTGVQFVLLLGVMLAASLADLKGRVIPNVLIVCGIAVRVIWCLLSSEVLANLLWSVLGGIVVALPVLLIVVLMDRRTGRSNMGGGDIKLFFVAGLFFPWQQGLLLLFVACLVGILYALISYRGQASPAAAVPFGPAIALATWVVVLFGGRLLAWYNGFFI
jgi:leader peptidase (prepilin peptidase)/N-methyltransferase